MDGIFIDLYESICQQIDDNRNKTHNIKDNDEYEWTKEDCKYELCRVLNAKPEDLEPLYSRLAKCNAIKTRTYDVHVFDETTDKIFTNIWEYHNGQCEYGFSGLSILVTFADGDEQLDESVYIRVGEDNEFYIYDFKPHIVDYSGNSDTTEDTSKYGQFKKNHPRYAEYIEKWEKSTKDLSDELDKWSDMLWLGRSLHNYEYYDEITKGKVKPIQEKVIKKWENDPDFQKYMYDKIDATPDDEFGDSKWAEISCNVGALRYLLWGEWDLSS